MSSNIIFNGFRDNEIRTSAYRRRPSAEGHTTVLRSTQRLGSAFAFRYVVKCECGKRYTSDRSLERAERSMVAHQIKVLGRALGWTTPYSRTTEIKER